MQNIANERPRRNTACRGELLLAFEGTYEQFVPLLVKALRSGHPIHWAQARAFYRSHPRADRLFLEQRLDGFESTDLFKTCRPTDLFDLPWDVYMQLIAMLDAGVFDGPVSLEVARCK